MTTSGRLFNVALYHIVWFALVTGAAVGRPGPGLLLALAAIIIHLGQARAPLQELRLVALASLVGAVFESVLVASGWVRIDTTSLLAGVLPLWMVALWAVFATMLNVALRPLRSRLALTAVLAAFGAPLAYWGGARLGALEWVQVIPALLLIAAGWLVSMPLLMRCARRFDGFSTA